SRAFLGGDGDLPAVSADETPGDGQAEAGAGDGRPADVLGAVEVGEELLLLFGTDADAGIGHDQFGAVPGRCGADRDGAAGGGVLDGVGDQVVRDLVHLDRVGLHDQCVRRSYLEG